MEQLVQRAATMGHEVEFRSIPGRSGLLLPNGLILINNSKHEMTQRVALAHELGHVHYGHDWRRPHHRERDEVQADRYASRLLISPSEYAVAEAMYESPAAIAAELEVPVKLLLLWQSEYPMHNLSPIGSSS